MRLTKAMFFHKVAWVCQVWEIIVITTWRVFISPKSERVECENDPQHNNLGHPVTIYAICPGIHERSQCPTE